MQKLVTKPIALATHLDDAEFLAQIEAVDRFTDGMIAYPGRTFGQLYHRFVKGNALVTGEMELGGRQIKMSAITVPVLVFAGATDGIAPVAAVKAMVPLLTGSQEVRFEIVPGGHLGMLTGRAARGTTWQAMDEWISQWSTAEATPAKRRRARRREEGRRQEDGGQEGAAKKADAKKTVAKKAPAKKAAAKKAAPAPVVEDPTPSAPTRPGATARRARGASPASLRR